MNYGGFFEVDSKINKLEIINEEMNKEGFWENSNRDNILNEEKNIKSIIEPIKKLRKQVIDNLDILEMIKNDFDQELKNIVESDKELIYKKIEELELNTLLNGPYDSNDAIVEIHPGAGGTESCDWANMLYRMYTRYVEKNNFKLELKVYLLWYMD